jgi:uncharacterized protein YbjT (DUF2867 family)
MPQKLAILGATGLLGRPVAQELLAAGYEVTLLGRHPNHLRHLFPAVRVVEADLRNPDSLRRGLAGQEALYLNLSVRQTEKPTDFHTETHGLRNLLPIARELGIRRVGYLASLVMRYQGMNGFRWWVFDVKHEAVRLLKESGIPYLIFYPSTFLESFRLQRQGPFLTLGGTSDVRMGFITAHDYGRQVARAFALPAGESREYVVQGPERLTYAEAARRYVEHVPEKLRVVTAPVGVLQFLGLFSPQLNYAGHILEALNRYPEQFEAAETWRELGTPTTTVEEFARRGK